jgi:hypothetical protein
MITVTLEGWTDHYRPVPAIGLGSGDYEALTEHSPNTYPYELVNAASEYATRIPHRFVDPNEHDHILDLCLIDLPKLDHPTPTVNMADIRMIRQDSLSTILEEGTGSTDSRGTNYTTSSIHMGRSSQLFHPTLEALSSALVTTSPLTMRKPIKTGLPEKKEMSIIGLRESTWKTLKKM